MSFNDYNSRREFAAGQDYTRAIVQKRDLLARRIKGDDKKNNLDINKVIAEIRNGNLAALEELDKAGITYTLTDNSQAFDGKSDSQTVTFKIGDTTYTASYEGKTKEQEEAEKKQKAKGMARLESFLDSYENVNTKMRDDNTSSTADSVAPATQPEQNVSVNSEETIPTQKETTSVSGATDNTMSDSNTQVTNITPEISSCATDTISAQDSFNNINQLNYDKLEEHLAPLLELDGEFYMSQNEFDEIASYVNAAGIECFLDYKEDGYPAHTEVLRFTYKGNDYEITYKRTIDTRTVDDINDEQVINPKDFSDYTQIFVGDLRRFMEPFLVDVVDLFSKGVKKETIYSNIENIRELLSSDKELTGSSFNEAIAIILRDYYGITSNSTDGEFIEKIKKYVADTGANFNDITFHRDVYYGDVITNQIAFMYDLLEKVPGYKNCLKEQYIDYTEETITSIGTVKISPTNSPVTDPYDYEARLENNIQQLMTGTFHYSSFVQSTLGQIYDNLKHNLEELGIKYYELNGTILHFTYKGLDYEICRGFEEHYIKNTRTIDDVTEEDVNNVLSSSLFIGFDGGGMLFGDGPWDSISIFPEYDENWGKHFIDKSIEYSYYPYRGDDPNLGQIKTNLFIELLRDKCGIEDYKASKEANKAAFIEYLKSIDAYSSNGVDYYKLYKTLYDENPKFREYIKFIAIGPAQETTGILDEYVIVRTRPTQGKQEPMPDWYQQIEGIFDPKCKNSYTDIYYNYEV